MELLTLAYILTLREEGIGFLKFCVALGAALGHVQIQKDKVISYSSLYFKPTG